MEVIINQTADFKGLKAPMPIYKLGKELNNIESGQTLEIIADDPTLKSDLKAFCQLRKHEILTIQEDSGILSVVLKKN